MEHINHKLHTMKIDLDSSSKGLCSAGFLALIIHECLPDTPRWLGGYGAVALVAGLGFMLAHEITARKHRERAVKAAVEPK
jgi:hypothetical protein